MRGRGKERSGVWLALVAATTLLGGGPALAGPDAKKVFFKSCAPCHGKQGTPNAVLAKMGVRNFKDADWQKSRSDAQLEKAIREGRPGTMMAAFQEALSAEEIAALVAFIRTLEPAK